MILTLHETHPDVVYLLARVRHERRARNIMAILALVGWVLALAALGGAV